MYVYNKESIHTWKNYKIFSIVNLNGVTNCLECFNKPVWIPKVSWFCVHPCADTSTVNDTSRRTKPFGDTYKDTSYYKIVIKTSSFQTRLQNKSEHIRNSFGRTDSSANVHTASKWQTTYTATQAAADIPLVHFQSRLDAWNQSSVWCRILFRTSCCQKGVESHGEYVWSEGTIMA
jgi:hypothetical protein